MKKLFRILLLSLALAVLTVAFASCDDETGNGGGPAEKKAWDEITDETFQGQTLNIFMNDFMGDIDAREAGASSCLDYMRGLDEDDEDEAEQNRVLSAATDRFADVLDILHMDSSSVNFISAGWDGDCDSILPSLQELALAGSASSNSPSLVIHENYGIVRAGILGLLYNAYEDGTTNYLDFSYKNEDGTSPWYLEMMEENTIDKDKIYMLFGDFFIDQFRMSYAVLANATLINNNYKGNGGLSGMDLLYSEVQENDWDYDKMMKIADLCDKDYNPIGVRDKKDIMGVVGSQWCVRSFFATSGIDVFEKDLEGNVAYVESISDVDDWVNKFVSMEKKDYFNYWWQRGNGKGGGETASTCFVDGRAAFAIGQAVVTFESKAVQGMDDDAALLPNPRYSPDSGKYKAMTSDNANSGGILITSSEEQFALATAFLQLMAEYSADFMYEYYDNNLMLRANMNKSYGQLTMIEYIHDGICSPMSMLYDNYCAKSLGDTTKFKTYASIMYESIENKANSFTSTWESQIGAKRNQWQKIVENYGTGQ